MAESVVTFLLNELSVWLHEERNLLGALGNEVQIIVDKLEHMRAFLKVADAEEESNPQLKVWLCQLREIAYDIEDVLERYEHLFAHTHANGIKGRLKKIWASVKHLKAKHELASKLQEIRLRAEESSKTYNDMYAPRSNSSALGIADTCYDGRSDALLLEDAEVVGIEAPRRELLNWLYSSDYDQRVVSVVGMAGLGKTTLVKKVYDNSVIKNNFHHHVWVTVSESFNIDNFLREMIKQLSEEVKEKQPSNLEGMSSDAMREFIYKFLHNKKYIIVLDDVWKLEVWEALKYSFPRSNTQGHGCIIITTRFNHIGDAACSQSGNHVYVLQRLPPQEAEQLFYRKAFPNIPCPQNLIEISESIIKKCEGWPLAIVVIGGLLATKKNNFEEWRNFSQNMGSELGDSLKKMQKLLSLSYYDLPYHLKACFLYLSFFPEDHVLEKATIIRLWSAEGLVEAKERKTKEKIVEGCLNELCNRNLVQVVERYDDGRTKGFGVHDLVREYLITKAREQNIVAALNHGDIKCRGRVRRLILEDSSITCIEQISTFKYLRSLLYFGSSNQNWAPIFCKILQGDCRMMKTLDLRGALLDKIPDEVFKLYNLRCLCLRDTNISFIPKSIGNLGKLETLDLKRTKVTELPFEILKLHRLQYLLVYRYIYVDGYINFSVKESFKAPYLIGQLLCLEKLSRIDAGVIVKGGKIVREIGKLTKLQRLGIVGLRREDGNELCCSLAKLVDLRSLEIKSIDEREVMDLDYSLSLPLVRILVLSGCLERLPKWIRLLNEVTVLSLSFSRLIEDPLRYIQGLPSLLSLILDCAYEGEEISFNGGGFQRLKRLCLMRLSGLKRVSVENGSMPCLQELEFWNCRALLELHDGIQHLTTLQKVDFYDMAPEFVEKVSKGERDTKLAHIRIVRVFNQVEGQWESYEIPSVRGNCR